MEGLDMGNILSPDEIDGLFSDEGTQESQVAQPTQEQGIDKDITTEVSDVDPESLFDVPESVGSGKEDTQGGENANSNKDASTSPKNFYSSIASALKEEGILSDLDDESLGKIQTPEDFAEAMEKQIQSKFDERQKRIDEALEMGIEPTEIKKYEKTIQYLNSITEESIIAESKEAETLRKQLIFQDFLNRGYDQKRAEREVQKSLNAGSDIEDAKEALVSNRDHFKTEYEDMISDAKEKAKEEEGNTKKEAESLRKSILEDKEIFKGIELDKPTREKIYNSVSKPVYKDPESGEYLTAVQKYQRDNKSDFMKKLGLLFVLTDNFSNLDKLVKPTVDKKVKSSLRELEHTINNTRRNTDGNLSFISGVGDDPESKVGWAIDA